MVERGRYGSGELDLFKKICRFCCSNIKNMMVNFECLPFPETPIIETEEHVLNECPAYHSLRISLSENLRSLLMFKEYAITMSSTHLNEFGRYLQNSYRIRNPKDFSND
jgi:hypothetical protein